MTKIFGADCPCGFSFKTPHGKDDAVAYVQLHVQRVHKKDYPHGVTKEEASEHVKEM